MKYTKDLLYNMGDAARYIDAISDDGLRIKTFIQTIVLASNKISNEESNYKLAALSKSLPPETRQRIYDLFSHPLNTNEYIRSFFSDTPPEISTPFTITDMEEIENNLHGSPPEQLEALRAIDSKKVDLIINIPEYLIKHALSRTLAIIDGSTFCSIMDKYGIEYKSSTKALPRKIFYHWLEEAINNKKPINNEFVSLMFQRDDTAEEHLDLYIDYVINFFYEDEYEKLLKKFRYMRDTTIIETLEKAWEKAWNEKFYVKPIISDPITPAPITHAVPQHASHQSVMPIDVEEAKIRSRRNLKPVLPITQDDAPETQRRPTLPYESYKPKSTIDEEGNIVISQVDLLYYIIKKTCAQ